MAYLNFYFLIYMYTLITSFVTGLFICMTNCCIKIHSERVRKAIEESIRIVDWADEMDGEDCPICLNELKENEEIAEIKCKHLFHCTCLKEWIKLNQTCPSCRYHIFDSLEV